MTQNLKFSIITVCRNHLDGLKKTKKSLESQTFQGFEWVVIDGASTDGSIDFLRQNPPHTLFSEPDSGPYDAMNKGIACAKGDYYLFLNAGDMLASDDILALLDAHLTNNPDFLYGDSFEENQGKKHYKIARSHRRAILGMFTHHQAMIYKAELLDHLRYDTRYKIAADYDFTLRYLQKCEHIIRLRKPICIFEQGGLSQNQAKLGRREQRKIRRELKICYPLTNNLIMFAQKLNLGFRHFTPWLYWPLKRAFRR